MVKGAHSSSNNGTPVVVGVGSNNSSNSGSVNGTTNGGASNVGNVVQNVNAVAAAATYSLSQRYKNVAGSHTNNNSSPNYPGMNGDALVAESNNVTVSSTHQQPVPLSEYVGSGNTTASRPTSASGVRTSASGAPPQRPLSAYAMRR